MPMTAKSPSRNVVLVHGGFVDGSGWEAVYRLLRKDGFTVSIVQNPTISLGDDPKVNRLVYIAAFAPDKGESVSSLIKHPPPGAPVPPILPPQDGFLFLDKIRFHASFAADVDTGKAEFMADSQVPWGVEALNGAISQPAWKTKPSWYLIAIDDRMIPPDAQRLMSKRAGATVVEVPGSHAVYVSQPDAVAGLIARAAKGN